MSRFGERVSSTLKHTYRAIQRVESASLRSMVGSNLSISEMHMIECIGRRRGSGISVTDIAQEMDLSLATVTVAVKKLEKKGYVSKEKCTKDGRRVLIRLTDNGRRVEISQRYFHHQMANAIERAIPNEEREVLLSGFQTIDGFFTAKANEMDTLNGAAEAKGEK